MSISILPTFAKIYIYILTFVLGLFMGSALNCLAYRLSNNQKWSSGRSKCPGCGHVLAVKDLIPLFSWLFLKGRCRYCGGRISPRYPLSELLLGLCFVALLIRFGLSLQLLVCLILAACLFTLSLVDIDTLTIPDRFIIIPAVARMAQLLIEGGLSSLWYGVYHGLILGGAVLALALVMDRVLHKESMGGGDIKLLFMLGLYFDLPCSLLLLLASCIIGIIAAAAVMKLERDVPFPFGPSISAGAVITLLIGQSVTGWYMSLF